jgi:hypothetical protein
MGLTSGHPERAEVVIMKTGDNGKLGRAPGRRRSPPLPCLPRLRHFAFLVPATCWRKKILGNRRRDREVNRLLRRAGWRMRRIGEHALTKKLAPPRTSSVARVRQVIHSRVIHPA